MTQELLERTVRDWVYTNPHRGARELGRLRHDPVRSAFGSPDEIANELIQVAGRMQLANSRAW